MNMKAELSFEEKTEIANGHLAEVNKVLPNRTWTVEVSPHHDTYSIYFHNIITSMELDTLRKYATLNTINVDSKGMYALILL